MIYDNDRQFKMQIRTFLYNYLQCHGMKQKYIAGKLGVSPANFSRLIASEKDSLRLMKAKEILNTIGYDIDITIVHPFHLLPQKSDSALVHLHCIIMPVFTLQSL